MPDLRAVDVRGGLGVGVGDHQPIRPGHAVVGQVERAAVIRAELAAGDLEQFLLDLDRDAGVFPLGIGGRHGGRNQLVEERPLPGAVDRQRAALGVERLLEEHPLGLAGGRRIVPGHHLAIAREERNAVELRPAQGTWHGHLARVFQGRLAPVLLWLS